LAMDHAASYRAIKNGNVKNFLAVTPVMSDINTLKSSFDKRSQLNLRRMQEYLASGDNKKYKYFLKNQTELENLWKTMTGSQSSLGKIRVRASGPQKGKIKITDYGSTSLLDKNKNLLDELANNLDIRKNIVNASSVENLDTARRIMLEGSELTEKKMLGTMKKTDRSAKTIIDQSFENINKPAMFKKEQKIAALLEEFGCGRKAGGRILMKNGGATLTECAIAGQKKLNLGLTNGFDKTEGELAKKILQAGRGLGSAFALRNILGPAAIGFTVAAEAGLVGYDMLATGKSFKEAVGSSLFNYALGDKTKIDNKKLRYQGYADAGLNENQIGKISAYENAIDEMNNTFAEFDKENELYTAAVTGGPKMSDAVKQKQIKNFYDQANKNKALIQDLARTQTEDRLDKALDPMVPALMSDADAKRKAMQLTKPTTVKFGNFMDTVFPKGFLSDTTYAEDRDKAINYMPEVQEYYRGNRFARGGLSGGDTSGRPPESGPMSQGLRSLYKNGRKL